MDITLLPPTTILSHHSHQIYHPLLPSALPRRRSAYPYSCSAPRSPFTSCSTYRSRRRFDPPPPIDGSCPMDLLPDEIVLSILSFLDWDELLSIRAVDRRLSDLALAPALHHSLTLLSLPPSPLPSVWKHILPATQHLHLHLFPYPSSTRSAHRSSVLFSLLEFIPPDQLRSLSLPFSAPYLPLSEMGVISRIGGKLERLDLRGSGLAGPRWGTWLANVGAAGSGLKHLDLGFTSISSLPLEHPRSPTSYPLDRITHQPPTLNPFRSLISLSLASCSSLPLTVLTRFLATLPPTLERLDLSRLDIRRLKRHWEDQRRACFPQPLAAPVAQPIKGVWGVPRTPSPELRSVPLSPPDTPVASGRRSVEGSAHPFYPCRRSQTPVHNFRLPTPPSSQRSTPDHETDQGDEKKDPISINIVHSAILESEDEAGYRQFIGEVVGGTVGVGAGVGVGIGLGLEWDQVQGQGEEWLEVDGGGVM